VHARHGAAAQIERDPVGLLMIEGGFNALSGIHGENERLEKKGLKNINLAPGEYTGGHGLDTISLT
jgi:hypothetical protein